LLRRNVVILLLLAVGIQTLPLRACAVEQAISGQSCHDDVAADGRLSHTAQGLDGHATDGPGHADCRCELPKGDVDRHVPVGTPLDLVAPFPLLPDLTLPPTSLAAVPPAGPPPEQCTAPVTLPLLI
jgi:hypothetical protein